MEKDIKTKRNKLKRTLNPEAREKQLISLAMDAAEEQFINGTASSQVITHFLKLATAKEELERKRLEANIALANAKKKDIDSNNNKEKLYREAIAAFKGYSGEEVDENEYEQY